jgi:signal transduction histidine kinase/CheY-like chemotaxis protein
MGALVGAIAVLVLIGWIFDIAIFRTFLPGLVSMQPATAVMLAFLGTLLVPVQVNRGMLIFASATIVSICSLFIVEYLVSSDLGIDRVLFTNAVSSQTVMPLHPGRMPEGAAVGLALLAGLILVEGIKTNAVAADVWTTICLVPFMIGVTSLLAYWLNVRSAHGVVGYTDIAFQTALCLCVLSVAVAARKPQAALIRMVSHPGETGKQIRRVLIAIVAIPPILSWLALHASHAGLVSTDFRIVLTTAGTMFALVALTTVFAQHIIEAHTVADQERQRAEAATAAKTDFLANMSHEIRTPLTAILGFSDLLRTTDDLPPSAQHYAARISTAGDALLSLVNTILDFSKIEAGQIDIRPRLTDVAAATRELVMLLQPEADAKGVTLSVTVDSSLPDVVYVDPERYRQILLNLLSNAVKFTEVGTVSVHLSYRESAIFLRVTDTGIGMPPDAQAQLFERYTQIDGAEPRKHTGTGLGLAITKGLVEAMHGQVGVNSVQGVGSEFWVTVPASVAVPSTAATTASEVVSLHGLRVLVTDDNPVTRELARSILENAGAEVSDAEDGAEGVRAASILPYDAILMDLRMPVMDGVTAARTIRRQDGPNRDIPIIAFTANVVNDLDKSLFDGVISKPVMPGKLKQILSDVLSKRYGAV